MFSSPARRGFTASMQCMNRRPVYDAPAMVRAISMSKASSSRLILGKSSQRSFPSISTQQAAFSTSSILREQDQHAEAAAEEVKEMDDGEKNIHDILTREFQPEHLEVRDVSGGCGSFYAIVVASEHFNGKPTVKAHRLVNEALKDVIAGIHGLQLRTMPIKK